MRRKVVIIGAGVAGLTAAHELIERGFSVDVFERAAVAGGKARSIPVAGSGSGGRKDLPGEHGFRFFPGFYQHTTDTMKRIPFGSGRRVFDNLIEVSRAHFLFGREQGVTAPTRLPRSLEELRVLCRLALAGGFGLTNDELECYATKVWQLLTSCEERIAEEYEQIGWAQFLEAEGKSLNYRRVLGEALTKTLIAADGRVASARTIGTVGIQILLDTILGCSDRVLNGPTSQVWIEPWVAHLKELGVKFHFGADVSGVTLARHRVLSISVGEKEICGDDFLFAVPVEVLARLLGDNVAKEDPHLQGVEQLAAHTEWMMGVQYFLRRRIDGLPGHINLLDSPWSLTLLFQAQYWPNIDLKQYGDGTVRDVLSVDVSDWNTPGVLYGKPARACTLNEIREEVWAQLEGSLRRNGHDLVSRADVHTFFIGPGIRFDPTTGLPVENDEPLLVNRAGSWRLRPQPYCEVTNLFFAADCVRTNTNLATMESANEAARRAVNCIIDASGARCTLSPVWKLREPWLLQSYRKLDRERFSRGLPWQVEMPWWVRALQKVRVSFAEWFGKRTQRRTSLRNLPHGASVRFEEKAYRASLLDLSAKGLGVLVEQPSRRLDVGREIRMTIREGDSDREILLIGVVKHRLDAGTRGCVVGLELRDQLSPALMRRFKRSASGRSAEARQ